MPVVPIDISRLKGDRVTFNLWVVDHTTSRKLGSAEAIRRNTGTGADRKLRAVAARRRDVATRRVVIGVLITPIKIKKGTPTHQFLWLTAKQPRAPFQPSFKTQL